MMATPMTKVTNRLRVLKYHKVTSKRSTLSDAPQWFSSTSFRKLDFEDHRNVFGHKSTLELWRALLILRVCSFNFFVDNNLQLFRMGSRLLGARLFASLARPTFYAQFVGGESEQELDDTYKSCLQKVGLQLMVCPVQEEDVGDSEGMSEEQMELKYEANKQYIMHAAEAMAKCTDKGILQCKITAFMSADLVIRLGSLVEKANLLSLSELVRLLCKTLEGTHNILSEDVGLDQKELSALNSGLRRLKEMCDLVVSSLNMRLLVDAEYTYMNVGIAAVALALMVVYNKEQPMVGSTYQCYLKDAFTTISRQMSVAEEAGVCFAAKVVRGAYMEKERALARKLGYADPVNPTYEATGEMYDRVINMYLDKIEDDTSGRNYFLVIATHNEESVRAAVQRLSHQQQVAFAQIYGMADQISMPLVNAGFMVYKSVPYGPLSEVLPYLSRRTAENRIVLAGARKEQRLLRAELRRRLLL